MGHARQIDIRRTSKWVVFGVLYFLVSIFALGHHVASSHLGDRYKNTKYEDMMDGTAHRPFVYRILVPQLTQAIVQVIPVEFRKDTNRSIRRWLTSPSAQYTRQAMPWLGATYNVPHPFPRLVTTFIIYCALIGYAVMLFKLATVLMPNDGAARWFAPLIGMLAISAFSKPWQYIYDIPTLFLSASCFYLLFTQRMKLYLICFLIACLNKETVIFNFIFFLIWCYDRMPRPTFIAFSLVQLSIYTLIKIIITYSYANNGGFFLEFNLARVLRLDVFEQASYYKIVALCMLFFLFTYQWRNKPLFLKRSLWLLPIIYVGYVFYGNGEEFRVFFDIKPLMVLLATHTLMESAGFAILPFFNDSGET